MPTNKPYTCKFCGRSFVRPLAHRCVGGYRKHKLHICFGYTPQKHLSIEEEIQKHKTDCATSTVVSRGGLEEAFMCGFEYASELYRSGKLKCEESKLISSN